MVIGLSGAHLVCNHTNYNKSDKQAVGVQFCPITGMITDQVETKVVIGWFKLPLWM